MLQTSPVHSGGRVRPLRTIQVLGGLEICFPPLTNEVIKSEDSLQLRV